MSGLGEEVVLLRSEARTIGDLSHKSHGLKSGASHYDTNSWEILVSNFEHIRTGSYAQRQGLSSSSSCLESQGLSNRPTSRLSAPCCQSLSVPPALHSLSRSAPSSPKNDPKLNPPIGSSDVQDEGHPVEAKPRLFIKRGSTGSTVGGIIRKISRVKRPPSRSWVVIEIDANQEHENDNSGCRRDEKRSQSVCDSIISNDDNEEKAKTRSSSDSRLQGEKSKNGVKVAERVCGNVSSIEILNEVTVNEKRNHEWTSARGPFYAIPVIVEPMEAINQHGSRFVEPPNSLNLKRRITVEGSPGPHQLITNNMESVESIGNCSIDATSSGISANSKTRRSISDRSLRSTNLSSGDHSDEQTCLSTGVNGHVPSYVGISCAISGYSNYSRYCASSRTSLSPSNSPTIRLADSPDLFHSKPVTRIRPETSLSPRNVDEANGESILTLTPVVTTEVIGADNGQNGSIKSLVQQRIESLYGQSFAAGWRDSRCKIKVKKPSSSSGTLLKYRSPSCPPQSLAQISTEAQKKSPPVFQRLEKAFVEQLQLKDGVTPTEVTETEDTSSTAKNGDWFISELNTTCDAIRIRIKSMEAIIEKEGNDLSDEMAGKLRSAVGKANLLLTQKLAQFRELCIKNITGSKNDGFETKIEDLEGFWEMVWLQVEDINQIFDEIEQLKANLWVVIAETPSSSSSPSSSTQPKQQPKMRSPRKSTPKGSPAKGGQTDNESAAARDVVRKNRLREAKRKQAAKRNKVSNEDEVTIFVSQNQNQERTAGCSSYAEPQVTSDAASNPTQS